MSTSTTTSKTNLDLLYALAATALIIGVAYAAYQQLATINTTGLIPLWANAVTYAKTIMESTQIGGGIMFIFGMYGYVKNKALAAIAGTSVAFNFNYYMSTFAMILGELGAVMVAMQGYPQWQQLGDGIVALANMIKSVLGDLFGNQTTDPITPTPGTTTPTPVPAPPTPSTIPPPPSLPATVNIPAIVTIKSVTVDGTVYTMSSTPGTAKALQWTSTLSPDKTKTQVSIAFPDYSAHGVIITYDSTTLSVTLSAGSTYTATT
jgi:hypothetical protein